MRVLPSNYTTFPKNFSGPHDKDYYINITLSDTGIFNQFLKLIRYMEDNPTTQFTLRPLSFTGRVTPNILTLLKLNPNFTLLS